MFTSASPERLAAGDWTAGVTGGILGAAAMTSLLLATDSATLSTAIPSLYGLAPPERVGVGLAIHLSHGAVLGVAFAAIVGAVGVESPLETVIVGAFWGVVTWGVLILLVMPVWLSAVGSPATAASSDVLAPLLWHLVYGTVLGVVYSATADA
ncbi:MAG: DUF6789 family protein [Halolamina sp.]